jgi:hypothetical protein
VPELGDRPVLRLSLLAPQPSPLGAAERVRPSAGRFFEKAYPRIT